MIEFNNLEELLEKMKEGMVTSIVLQQEIVNLVEATQQDCTLLDDMEFMQRLFDKIEFLGTASFSVFSDVFGDEATAKIVDVMMESAED